MFLVEKVGFLGRNLILGVGVAEFITLVFRVNYV